MLIVKDIKLQYSLYKGLVIAQNVKKRLQYSIYNTLWFTPWGVFLTSFNKIHTTFHTKFRLFSTICQVYQGFK